MPKLYAEWVNVVTKQLCRISFELRINAPFTMHETVYRNKVTGVIIRDYAISKKCPLRKSAIFADGDTPFHKIVETLRQYIEEYYTTERDTLKVNYVE